MTSIKSRSWYHHIAHCKEPYCVKQRTRPLNRVLLWFIGVGEKQ